MASRAITPSKYTPKTAMVFKDRIGEAIVGHIAREKLAPVDVYQKYPSIRPRDLDQIRRGNVELFGLCRLIAVCEAIGLPLDLQIGAQT